MEVQKPNRRRGEAKVLVAKITYSPIHTIQMTSSNFFTCTCSGSTSDAPVDRFEVEAVLFDATTCRWDQLSGQAVLRGVLESARPSFGLSLRLPTSLVLVTFSGVSRMEIVDGCTSAVLVEEVPKPRAKGIKHKSSQNTASGSNSTSNEEYEIDEYLEDKFAETQQY